jgi:hypothetical protein
VHSLKAPIINAIHFRRGVNIFRVKAYSDKPSSNELDLSVAQAAWWDAIQVFERNARERTLCPANVALELRVTGGCDSAQHGNDVTCSVEESPSLPLSREHARQLAGFNTDLVLVHGRVWKSVALQAPLG